MTLRRFGLPVLLALALLHALPVAAQLPPPGLAPRGAAPPAAQPLPPGAPQGVDALLNRNDPISTQRLGTATQAEGGAIAVGPLGDPMRVPGPATAVFGATLFNRAPPSPADTPNPNYVLGPGDRVSITIWGFVEGSVQSIIDQDGNVFIPQVGPIRLAGTRAGDIQRVVESEVRRVYAQQVQVYATVLSTGSLGVFVTGYVRLPGRHLGAASESVIDYLARAGGVDPGRGSFRNIVVRRGGRDVARVDLYNFLLSGSLPQISLQQGDTIVVAPQGALVGADGSVRNNFLFEVAGRAMAGSELLRLAAPLPAATNAVIRGTRGGQPFARYVTVRELSSAQLLDQDTVSFITDAPAPTVRVSVEGSRIGPSVLIADRDASLCTVLDYIEVDPRLANTRGVFLLRPGLAQAQQRTINEALDRLERQLFLAVSATTGVAQIRASEANLVASYIQRARRTAPEGRLVVMDRSGRCADVRVQDGDTIVIPERVETVLVGGEVRAPQAVVWRQNMRLSDYIEAAGGFAERGSSGSVMIRKASGRLILDANEAPEPGDEVVALPMLDPKYFQIGSDLLNVIFQTALVYRTFD
ncbi:polysaccharide biosynthesis/export family protein [Falsiroseomonas bella]|nr:polysaccharide biosynthesis/export family protein [Falsiroseomonas bella]